jgi:site-specific recombinase XerD
LLHTEPQKEQFRAGSAQTSVTADGVCASGGNAFHWHPVHSTLSPAGFRKTLARTGEEEKFPFPAHPHMLRHACGYKLANEEQNIRAAQHYLGHKNIQHTVRYTELSLERFRSFWED